MNTQGKYLQFANPTVLKFDFQVNDNFNYETTSTDTDINTVVEIPKRSEINYDDDIPVYLSVFINQDNDNAPYTINTRVLTLFRVDNTLTQAEAPLILQSEGASILLSYLRPMIAMITAASGFPTMTLPMLDFSDDN